MEGRNAGGINDRAIQLNKKKRKQTSTNEDDAGKGKKLKIDTDPERLRIMSWNPTMGGDHKDYKGQQLAEEAQLNDVSLIKLQEAPSSPILIDWLDKLQTLHSPSWERESREKERNTNPRNPSASSSKFHAGFYRSSKINPLKDQPDELEVENAANSNQNKTTSGRFPRNIKPVKQYNPSGTRLPVYTVYETEAGNKVQVANFHNEAPGLQATRGMENALQDMARNKTDQVPQVMTADTNLKTKERKKYKEDVLKHSTDAGNYDVISSELNVEKVEPEKMVKKEKGDPDVRLGDHPEPVIADILFNGNKDKE